VANWLMSGRRQISGSIAFPERLISQWIPCVMNTGN